jgi:hypothetical protein
MDGHAERGRQGFNHLEAAAPAIVYGGRDHLWRLRPQPAPFESAPPCLKFARTF